MACRCGVDSGMIVVLLITAVLICLSCVSWLAFSYPCLFFSRPHLSIALSSQYIHKQCCWYSVMALVGKWGRVERSSCSCIPPPPHQTHKKHTTTLRGGNLCLCAQYRQQLDMRNQPVIIKCRVLWNIAAVPFPSRREGAVWGSRSTAVDCTAAAQIENPRCYMMLVLN